MKSKDLLVYLGLVCSMIIWGFSFIWSKMVFEYYTPFTAIIFRLIMSTAFLLALGFCFKWMQKVSRKEFMALVLLSFLEPFLYYIGEYFGLRLASPTLTAVVISTIPLFAPIAAYMFFREKVRWTNVLGILISVTGVMLVILKDDLTFQANPIGIALLGLSVVTAIFYAVLIAKLSVNLNAYTIITYQNGLGIIWFVPFFLAADLDGFLKVGFQWEPFFWLLLLSVFASSLAYIFNTYGIQKIGITRSSVFTNTIPVSAALFSFFVMGERLSPLNIFGIGLVIAGLFMSQVRYKFKFTEGV